MVGFQEKRWMARDLELAVSNPPAGTPPKI